MLWAERKGNSHFAKVSSFGIKKEEKRKTSRAFGLMGT